MKILYKPNCWSQQRQKEKKRWIWPVHLAMEATYYHNAGHAVTWDESGCEHTYDKVITELEGLPFLKLPSPDRHLTEAFAPAHQRNGNYKHHPGTYIQSASGCWWGKCTFCKEKDKKYSLRSVGDVIKEIKSCKEQGFKEIFDDAASFATGEWRDRFIEQLKPLGMTFSCNMRFGTRPDFAAMKEAGFRMLLYGLESERQETLNMIHKGIYADNAVKELRRAASYGLEPHVAVMFGYPWESDTDANNTLKMVHFLLENGYAKTAQASLYTPLKGTPMHISTEPCSVNSLDKAWQNIDHAKYISRIYWAAFYPLFWINKIKDIKSWDDVKYIWRGAKAWIGK